MLPLIIFVSFYLILSSIWPEISIIYLVPVPIFAYFFLCFILSKFFNIEMATVNDVVQSYCQTDKSQCRIVVSIIYDEKVDTETFLAKLKQRTLIHPYYHKLKKTLYVSKRFMLFGCWVPTKNFNLDDHYEVLDREFSNDDLFNMMSNELSSVDFIPDKPNWKFFLLPNLEGNRSALIMKIQHSYIDGISGFTYFLNLTDCRNYSFIKMPKINKWQWIYIFLLGFLQCFPSYIKYVSWPWDKKPFHSGNVTGKKRIYSTELCTIESLKKFTKEEKVTINDTLTALFALSVKKYYEENNMKLVGDMLTMIPTSLREMPTPEKHYPLSNESQMFYVYLPLWEKFQPGNFAEMVRIYHKIFAKIKGSYESYFMKFALEVMPLFFPPSLIRYLITFTTSKISLLVSNVPGPTTELVSYGKYKVKQILSTVNLFSDLELAVSIISYNGKISVTCIADEINRINPKRVLQIMTDIMQKEVLKIETK